MKKNNNLISRNKRKRAQKNKKRLTKKNQLKKFETAQAKIYNAMISESILRMAAEKKSES